MKNKELFRALGLIAGAVALFLFVSHILSTKVSRDSELARQADRYDELFAEVKSLRNKYSKKKEDCSRIEQDARRAKNDQLAAEERLARSKDEVTRLSEQLKPFAESGVDVDALQRRVADLQAQLQKHGAAAESLTARELDVNQRQLRELKTQLGDAQAELSSMNATLQRTQQEERSLRELLSVADADAMERHAALVRAHAKVAACDEQRLSANETIARLLQELEGMRSSAELQKDTRLSLKDRHIFELQGDVREARSEAKRLRASADELVEQLQECERERHMAGAGAAAGNGAPGAAGDGGDTAVVELPRRGRSRQPRVDAAGYCAPGVPQRGRWFYGKFVTEGCFYHLYTQAEARRCLSAKRIVIYGDTVMKDWAWSLFRVMNAQQIADVEERVRREHRRAKFPDMVMGGAGGGGGKDDDIVIGAGELEPDARQRDAAAGGGGAAGANQRQADARVADTVSKLVDEALEKAHMTQSTFCLPIESGRGVALPGCRFTVREETGENIVVEWYHELQYFSPLFVPTLGELRLSHPDVLIGSVGLEDVLHNRAQWQRRLITQVPELLLWLSKTYIRSGAASRSNVGTYYWRSQSAIYANKSAGRVADDVDELLSLADESVLAQMRIFDVPIIDASSSTRAPGAIALYSDHKHHAPIADLHVNMFLNAHCNAKLGLSAAGEEAAHAAVDEARKSVRGSGKAAARDF